jgi:MoaA/NifB/PqqE/SkfB family radical SAM enzyme
MFDKFVVLPFKLLAARGGCGGGDVVFEPINTCVDFALKRNYLFGGHNEIMFINSQGNVCSCDFTMVSFGNILERPIQKIWEETSKHFCTPGRHAMPIISATI